MEATKLTKLIDEQSKKAVQEDISLVCQRVRRFAEHDSEIVDALNRLGQLTYQPVPLKCSLAKVLLAGSRNDLHVDTLFDARDVGKKLVEAWEEKRIEAVTTAMIKQADRTPTRNGAEGEE